MQFLFDDEELRFQFLTDLTAVHYPNQPGRELAVVYHLHNLTDNIRLRFKVFTSSRTARYFYGDAIVLFCQLDGAGDLRFLWVSISSGIRT
jgi:hypothetical protein